MRMLRRTALLGSLLVGCGGVSTVDVGDASAPGASAASTSQAGTTLAVARELARPERAVAEVLRSRAALHAEGAGLAATPRTPGDLALHVAATAGEPTRVGTDDDHSLTLSLEGSAPSRVESDDGSAVHRDVFPGTDAIWATSEARAELLLLLRDERAPTRFSFRLGRGGDLPRVVRGAEGLSFQDVKGRTRLRIPTPIALDANGNRRAAELTLSEDGRTLSIALDAEGLARPILLDPAIDQGRWTSVGNRGQRTMATFSWDPVRAKLIGYGGYVPGSNDHPGNSATATFAYDFATGGTFDGLADGPYGFTSAMLGPSGGGAFEDVGFFGAFDSARGKLVALGGSQYTCGSSGCTTANRMYAYEWTSSSNTWAQRCTTVACLASAPPATQSGVENVFDAVRKVNVVCRGGSFPSCWKWDGTTVDGTWTALAAFPSTFLGRGWYDPKYGATTFFGGDGTYSWNGTAWVKRSTSTLTGATGVTYDTLRSRAVAITVNGTFSDTWEWDGTGGAWTMITSGDVNGPIGKPYVAMGFDPLYGRVVAWGGGNGQGGATQFDFQQGVWTYQAFGNTCAGDADCEGGSCRDGFCCDQKCGACRRCDAPSPGGTCQPYAGAVGTGTEHDTCTGANACDPSGTCKLKPGQACAAGPECVSGACVDGVCCSTACNQACAVCNATPGTCTAAPKGSSGRGTCGVYACNGAALTCPATCASDVDCAAGGYCNGTTCAATQGPGATCARDRQCAGGACRDGVCCNSACNGACEACTTAKGASANGTCTTLAATTKPAACGGYACSGASSACATTCTSDAGCATGFWCDGTFCQKTRTQGDGCTSTSQCGAGLTCADGVCCNATCDGACQACAAAHKQSGDASGVCGPAKAGSDPGDRCPSEAASSCGKTGACDASGTCALFPKGAACGGGVSCNAGTAKGQTCDGLGACLTDMAGTACAPGTCTAASGCSFACASDGDCDATGFCDTGLCKARAPTGRTCSAANQCASGFCVDGVCCGGACAGVCEACNGVGTEGTCTAVTGPPRSGHGACASPGSPGPADACTAAACDGNARDACKALAGPELVCRTAACADGVESLATKCDGSGACPTAPSRNCAPFACAGARCADTCLSQDDCAKGNRCDVGSGKCVSNGTCDGDHTIVGADGSKSECAPYECDATGCKGSCASSDDCASPALCDGSKCVLSTAAPQASGGCAASSAARATGGSFASMLILAALAARRRTARKGAR
jgi:hypothetical protein